MHLPPEHINELTRILATRAITVPANVGVAGYFGGLIKQADLPTAYKLERTGGWSGDEGLMPESCSTGHSPSGSTPQTGVSPPWVAFSLRTRDPGLRRRLHGGGSDRGRSPVSGPGTTRRDRRPLPGAAAPVLRYTRDKGSWACLHLAWAERRSRTAELAQAGTGFSGRGLPEASDPAVFFGLPRGSRADGKTRQRRADRLRSRANELPRSKHDDRCGIGGERAHDGFSLRALHWTEWEP